MDTDTSSVFTFVMFCDFALHPNNKPVPETMS